MFLQTDMLQPVLMLLVLFLLGTKVDLQVWSCPKIYSKLTFCGKKKKTAFMTDVSQQQIVE